MENTDLIYSFQRGITRKKRRKINSTNQNSRFPIYIIHTYCSNSLRYSFRNLDEIQGYRNECSKRDTDHQVGSGGHQRRAYTHKTRTKCGEGDSRFLLGWNRSLFRENSPLKRGRNPSQDLLPTAKYTWRNLSRPCTRAPPLNNSGRARCGGAFARAEAILIPCINKGLISDLHTRSLDVMIY